VDLTTALQLIATASAVVTSLAVIALAYEVRQLRLTSQQPPTVTPFGGRHQPSSQSVGPITAAGFAIYVFRNNRWELESDLSAPGFEPAPPTIPGAFEGHVVKKQSRPSSEL
jgi:hypothetical protein